MVSALSLKLNQQLIKKPHGIDEQNLMAVLLTDVIETNHGVCANLKPILISNKTLPMHLKKESIGTTN